MYCNACGKQLPEDAKFCHQCGKGTGAYVRSSRSLDRPRQGRKIAGVCLGIARYLDVDPTLVRVLAVLSIFLGLGGVIAYIVAWILIPEEPLPGLDSVRPLTHSTP